tara:strand:+ start:535 stop:690 length:156 start_codon:yes stop_codon:yes gene_type:complete
LSRALIDRLFNNSKLKILILKSLAYLTNKKENSEVIDQHLICEIEKIKTKK